VPSLRIWKGEAHDSKVDLCDCVIHASDLEKRVTAAEDYPARPITVIVQLPPGGTLDLLARAFAPIAEKYSGTGRRADQGGCCGSHRSFSLAQAKPDGYTIGTGWPAMTQLIIGEMLAGRKPTFNIDDYVILGRLMESPTIFLVKYDSPWQTIKQVIEDVKAHPDTYAFSSGGITAPAISDGNHTCRRSELKLRHVPFRGVALRLPRLIADMSISARNTPGTSFPKIQAKQLRDWPRPGRPE